MNFDKVEPFSQQLFLHPVFGWPARRSGILMIEITQFSAALIA
jgi:hypothetical protein